MKKITLFFVFCTLSIIVLSQDVIIKRDGEKIQANVIEITSETIKYKKHEQDDGPIRNINIYDVDEIIYENGEWEKFEQNEKEASNTNSSRNIFRNNRRKEFSFFKKGLYIDGLIGGGIGSTPKVLDYLYDPLTGNYLPVEGSDEYTFTTIGFRIGHKWYFGENTKYKPGFQIQWAKIATIIDFSDFGDNTYFYISPFNIGCNNLFMIDQDNAIEANVIGGLTFGNTVPPPLDPDAIETGISYGLEIKYRRKRLAVGIDYTRINTAINYPNRGIINSFSLSAGIKL